MSKRASEAADSKTEQVVRNGHSDQVIYESLARFRSAMRRFLAFSEMATSEAGVTSQQYQALLVIQAHANEDITIGELADEMLLQHHGAVQLVDRLAIMGLVQRRRSDVDRRKVMIAMTADGLTLLKRLATVHIGELLKQEPLLAESLRRLRRIAKS